MSQAAIFSLALSCLLFKLHLSLHALRFWLGSLLHFCSVCGAVLITLLRKLEIKKDTVLVI